MQHICDNDNSMVSLETQLQAKEALAAFGSPESQHVHAGYAQ